MTARTPERLPIEGKPVLAQDGWRVRLPVRAEEITTSKETVVRERVVVRRKRATDVARANAVLRREQLRTTESGSADVHEEVTEKLPGI
jgi:uncharacterized protein (TIGR02271 family)